MKLGQFLCQVSQSTRFFSIDQEDDVDFLARFFKLEMEWNLSGLKYLRVETFRLLKRQPWCGYRSGAGIVAAES